MANKDGAWDVVIAGAGPAGLSAALVLGRARRKVLLCDTGTPRSWASKEMHGYLTRDGISPDTFRKIARKELRQYPSVEIRDGTEVRGASRLANGRFSVSLAKGGRVRARKLLIATGVFDCIPDIPGFSSLFGKGVYQCPYCEGWEMRDVPVAVYGKRRRGFEMARAMTAWTRDIILFTDGPSRFEREEREQLARNNIVLVEEKVAQLEERRQRLSAVVLSNGKRVARRALFFDAACHSQSRLAQSLGCRMTRQGGIKCGEYEASSVPGVFVAGNIIKDVQLVIVAAAEGTRAAFGINRTLTREDFEARGTGRLRASSIPLCSIRPCSFDAEAVARPRSGPQSIDPFVSRATAPKRLRTRRHVESTTACVGFVAQLIRGRGHGLTYCGRYIRRAHRRRGNRRAPA